MFSIVNSGAAYRNKLSLPRLITLITANMSDESLAKIGLIDLIFVVFNEWHRCVVFAWLLIANKDKTGIRLQIRGSYTYHVQFLVVNIY